MRFQDITEPSYFYENKEDLQHGMVFEASEDRVVMLDRPIPGDGTDWYVLSVDDDIYRGDSTQWSAYDDTIHPTDLRKQLA